MERRTCPACGRPQGTSAACLSCREAAARELAAEARDVTPPAAGGEGGGPVSRPPWYARAAPGGFRDRLRLLKMVARDCAAGSYRKMPGKAVAVLLAAAGYALSPGSLLPRALVPASAGQDFLLVAVIWRLMRRELREYCAWKGLAPAHFGL
ncbi:MAG TPA: hypothetical protein VFG59_07490 [Anaeromyxobacter sp.]|nr:hypothetical protein [Anaeromyxobacter sp.]